MYKHPIIRHAIAWILLLFLLPAKQGSSQSDSVQLSLRIDTSAFSLGLDTSLLSSNFYYQSPLVWIGGLSESSYILSREPSEAHEQIYARYKKLIGTAPTKKNYQAYYNLACSLWELGKTEEAKYMFLQIINSKEPYYCGTYYHSSDLGGGKKSGHYGYGSYTSNYKHYASCYLAKIHAEQKEFDQALSYVISADTIYPVQYNCGTGHMMHAQYMQSFYLTCYEGMGYDHKVVDLLLADYYNSTGALVRSLNKLYQPQVIRDSLTAALNSLVFVPDSLPTTYFSYENYGKNSEIQTEITFLSGRASMSLFGHRVEMRAPYLKQGEKATRDLFVKEFLESGLYRALSNEE